MSEQSNHDHRPAEGDSGQAQSAPDPFSSDPAVREGIRQLLGEYSSAVQLPPPGPGGVLGIGPPWTDPPPMAPPGVRHAMSDRQEAENSPEEHAPGAAVTWLVVVGMCVLFLLLTWLIIALPYGRHAHPPPIWVY